MKWNDHYSDIPEGTHALLGASQHSWLNYDQDKLFSAYRRRYSTAIGTLTHEYARKYIQHGIRANRGDKNGLLVHLLDNHIPANVIDINGLFKTWQLYVNDAVQARMRPEQPLFYSRNAFGTADAIAFRKEKLSVYDLKTGSSPVSMEQLYIYAALFCLEYDYKPSSIDIETRIYQLGECVIERPTAEDILPIMDAIVTGDELIEQYRSEGQYEP